MAFTKVPYYPQPAFNNLEVVTDEETTIDVAEVDPGPGRPARSISLTKVAYNDEIKFNVKAFVSSLFYDYQTELPTNLPGWAFNDRRLCVTYSIEGAGDFTAINGMVRRGGNVNLYNTGNSGFLTHRELVDDSTITMPKYRGYPTGVTILDKAIYSDALIIDSPLTTHLRIQTTTNNQLIRFPFTVLNPNNSPGIVLFGNDEYAELPNRATAQSGWPTTRYPVPGIYDVYIYSAAGQHYVSYGADHTANFINVLVEIVKIGRGISAGNSKFSNCTKLVAPAANIFDNAPHITDMYRFFYGCTSMTSISEGLLDNLPLLTNVDSCFMGVPTATIPPALFYNSPLIENFTSCFCRTNITTLTPAIFRNNPKGRRFNACFSQCPQLVSLQSNSTYGVFTGTGGEGTSNTDGSNFTGCFSQCPELVIGPGLNLGLPGNELTIEQMFANCNSIISVPVGLFNNLGTQRTGTVGTSQRSSLVRGLFVNCKSLTTVEGDIFQGADKTTIRTIETIFSGCTALTTVNPGMLSGALYCSNAAQAFQITAISTLPEDFFADTSLSNVSSMFSGCSNFNKAHSAWFKGNNFKTSDAHNFGSMFAGCSSLDVDGIPEDMFEDMDVTNIGYQSYSTTAGIAQMFRDCTSLTTYPPNLFKPLTGCKAAYYLFGGCTSLSTLPLFGGFEMMPLENVSYMFLNCTSISYIQDLFARNKEISNWQACFFGCTGVNSAYATPTTEDGYKCWERAGKPGYPTTMTTWLCFRERSIEGVPATPINTSDRLTIPAEWYTRSDGS